MSNLSQFSSTGGGAPFSFNQTPSAGIRHATLRGTSVTLLAQIFRQAISLIGTVVVARFVCPVDFGFIAMVVAPLTVVEIIREFSLMNVCVQTPELDHDRVNALFWFNALAGTAAAVIVMACSPWLSMFYGIMQIREVTIILAFGLLIASFGIQHFGLLRRQMRFGTVACVETVSTVASVVLGIVAAVAGWGYRALLVQILSARVISLVGVWVACAWRPTFNWRPSVSTPLLRNGAHLTGSIIVGVIARSLDSIVLARAAGPQSVGLYSRGMSICILPVGVVEGPLSAISVSALSRLRHDESRCAEASGLFLRVLTTLMAGAALALSLAPELIVAVILGPKWSAVTPLIPPLALLAVAIPLANAATVLATVYGTLSKLLKYSLVSAVLLIISVFCGALGGALVLAIAYGTTMVLTSAVSVMLITRSIIPGRHVVLTEVIPSMGVALAIWLGGVTVVSRFPLTPLMASWVRLVSGGALYGLWSWWYLARHRRMLRDLFRWNAVKEVMDESGAAVDRSR